MIPSPKEIMKLIYRIRKEDAFITVVGCVIETNLHMSFTDTFDSFTEKYSEKGYSEYFRQ